MRWPLDVMKQHDLRKTEHPELCRIRCYQNVCKKIIRLENTAQIIAL